MANLSFPLVGKVYHLEISYNYIAIGIDTNLYGVDSNSMSILWQDSAVKSFSSMKLIYPWLLTTSNTSTNNSES